MGSEWGVSIFKELYLIPSRNGLTKPKRVRGEGVKFINMGEIFSHNRMNNIPTDRVPVTKSEFENSRLEKNDLLFARQSLVLSGAGKCSIFLGDKEPVVFESHLIRIRLDSAKIYPDYLYYFFSSPQGRSEIWAITEQGAGQAGIRGSDLEKVKIPIPPPSEQKAIAHILGSLDDKIELNRQMNATLEAMAQGLFKSWFVDFDPVMDNALAAGNTIPAEFAERAARRLAAKQSAHHRAGALGGNQANDDLQAQFSSEFEWTEAMGWIPKGWGRSIIGDEIEAIGGGTPSTKEISYWEGGTHCFCTPKDMASLNSIILLDTERYLTNTGINKISSGQLAEGAVIMSSRAPIGYLAINHVPVSINQGIIALLPNDKYGSLYLMSWIHFNMDAIMERANGSTFLEISKKNFRTISFLSPSDQTVNFFNEQVSSVYKKILITSKQIIKLTNLRDTLLPKLLSGEVRIPDAEQLIEAA